MRGKLLDQFSQKLDVVLCCSFTLYFINALVDLSDIRLQTRKIRLQSRNVAPRFGRLFEAGLCMGRKRLHMALDFTDLRLYRLQSCALGLVPKVVRGSLQSLDTLGDLHEFRMESMRRLKGLLPELPAHPLGEFSNDVFQVLKTRRMIAGLGLGSGVKALQTLLNRCQ